MSSTGTHAPSFSRDLAVVLIVATAFLLVHPYTGIRHDGTLYAGDALARLMPGEFHDDPYFLFGSQGRFTLLPALYAGLISTLGMGAGTMTGLLVAFTLYLAAGWFLIARFVPRAWAPYCLLSVVLGWALYGGERVFAYAEPFLTARSFAEPLVLLAIACVVRGRWAWAFPALLLATVVHPLIAGAGWVVAWIYLIRLNRRWAWLAVAGVAALIGLGIIGRGPFGDVFARYDPEWLELVHSANGQAFVLLWSPLDYGVIFFDGVVLWLLARRAASPDLRRLVFAVMAAGLGATFASLVLVDGLGSIFFGKLQIWRAEWVMQWTAMAFFPVVAAELWQRRGEGGRIAAGLLALGWMVPSNPIAGIAGAMAVAIDAAGSRIRISAVTVRIVSAVVVVAALVTTIQIESRVFKLGVLLDQPLRLMVGQAFTMNLLVAFLAVSLIALARRSGWSALLLAIIAFVAATGLWDQRGAWQRKLESNKPDHHIWQGLIEPGARVYWYRDLIAPWILLGHGNFYTQQQSSGAVFSRDMTIELEKRRKVTAILDFQEQICRMMNNLTEKPGACEPDAEAVRTVCQEAGIDYVVIQSSLDGAKPIAEFSTGVIENGYEKKFYLYRCSALN
jgi:hypothetical protein